MDAERFFDFYSANGWKQGRENRSSIGKRRLEHGSVKVMRDKMNLRPGSTTSDGHMEVNEHGFNSQ